MKKILSAVALFSATTSNMLIAEEVTEVIVEGQHLSSSEINSIKTPTPILDVPQSLSIITSEQITQQAFTSIGDIINYTPGVNTSQGEGHRDAIVFRGVRSTADFYIDGVRDDVQYYRPLYNLEQVEILRGPNALLFGRGGTGGILNRVTKKGQLGEAFTTYQAGIDTFGEYSIQIDTNVDVSDQSALRINAYYADLENHRDFYDGDRLGINPTIRFELGSDTTIDVSYEYIDHERFIDRGIPTGSDGRPVEAFEDIVFGDPELNKTTLEAHVFRAALQHNFSDSLKANISAHYGDYDKFYQNFYVPDSANGNPGFDEESTPDVVLLDGYVDTTDRENLILSANLVSEFETGSVDHTLIAGAEYIDTSSDQDRFNASWLPDGNADSDTEIFTVMRPLNVRGGVGVNSVGTTVTNSFSDLNDDTSVDIEVNSFYIQDEIAISEQFDVVLGARFDSFDIEVMDAKNGGTLTRKDEEISPRAGLIYKPKENISIYASYSESFLPRSGEQFANLSSDADILSPDEFENSEIGLKWDFANNISLTVAYFESEQTIADRANANSEEFEVRGLEVEGFEVEVQGQITDNLSIRGGYTNLDGESNEGTDDPRELPENMASVWGTYQATDQWGFGLGATYQDNSLIKDGGTAKLPSYTRVDAAAYYDVSDKLRLQLNIENLTDELYFPSAHSTHQATVGAPLNARFTISGKL